ncbi:Uncharacterised protein [Mycobacterium tuberculosis]|nr:Uncharacterised protein [Mycobacterium tuberculosis]
MSPLRNPPSVPVECWNGPVFGSTIGDAGGGAAAVRVGSVVRRAGVLPAEAAPVAVLDRLLAAVRDGVALRALVVRDLGVDDFAAVLDALGLAAVLDDLVVRAVVVGFERLDAAEVDLRDDVPDFDELDFEVPALDEPDLDEVDFEVLALDEELLLAGVVFLAEPALVVVDLAVVVMTLAAESIAFAASDIALVALVIAFVIAVMALADEDALVATDFICVAAVLAWLAALVTRDAAADDALLVVVDFLAEPFFVPVDLLVVVREDELAADVRLAAGFLAVLDLPAVDLLVVDVFADVLFVRPAVPRLVDVRDAVLVGTDLPPVMISYGEIYSTLCDPLHTHRHISIFSTRNRPW